MNPPKRQRVHDTHYQVSSKRHKSSHLRNPTNNVHVQSTSHSVLSQCYPRLLSLRHFLISQLPRSSRLRKKKILESALTAGSSSFLDTTLVGVLTEPNSATDGARTRDFDVFTQSQKIDSSASGSTPTEAHIKQVSKQDFAVPKYLLRP